MQVILFGATGMVGGGVLRECLADPDVERVLTVGRSQLTQDHPKLEQLVQPELTDLSAAQARFSDFDACFFCLGVTPAGMTEEAYRRITSDTAQAAAHALLQANPRAVFVFVSGAGADRTGRGRVMWARVKGEAENALLALPFRGVYVFRPAYIQPMGGLKSRTRSYRWMYAVMAPLFPLWKLLFPKLVTTTEHLGRAMLRLAKETPPSGILESRDIEALGSRPPSLRVKEAESEASS